jgi:hypothetical protein
MANDAVDAGRDQPVSRLDGDQAAEPAAEHKDRPKSECAASDEEDHPEPTNGVSIKCQEVLSVASGGRWAISSPSREWRDLERRYGLEPRDELGNLS